MNSRRDSLLDHPILSSILVVVVYIAFLIIGEVIGLVIKVSLLDENVLAYQIIRFAILFLLNGLVLLWFFPKIMHIPAGKTTFNNLLKIIRLDRESSKPLSKNIIFAILSLSVFLFGYLIASLLTGEYVFDITRLLGFPDNEGNLKSFSFIMNLIPGFFEEVAFRGLILVLLLRKYSEKTSIIISGIMFGISHSINILFYGYSLNSLVQVISGILIGIFFAYVVLKSGTLIPTIIIHYLYNVFSILFEVFEESDPIFYFTMKIIFAISIPFLCNVYLARYFFRIRSQSPNLNSGNV